MQLPRLKEWRESRGLMQKELAAAAEISEFTVLRAEGGTSIRPSTARKIADALEISVADLMERPPVPLGEAAEGALGDATVRGWLEEQGATFALMSGQEFVDHVVELDAREDLKDLAREIDEERQRVERGLQNPAVRKALFPRRTGLPTKDERIREALRPAREAAKVRAQLGHEYTIKKLALENYSIRLYEEDEIDEVLLLVRPGIPEDVRRVMEARRRALREELAVVVA